MKPTRRTWIATAAGAVIGLLGFGIGRWTDSPEPPDSYDLAEAPLIGIASLSSSDYVRAVRDAGGIPITLPNTDGGEERIESYLALLDGLILPGGADIPPSEYGEEAHETVDPLDDDRFHFEKSLSRAWIEGSDRPLLGICLGSQWINVSSGGTLVQDIPSEYEGVSHRVPEHQIAIEPDSRLASILGETEVAVNSSHHQAVGDLGKGLRIVARCPDGVVEATETTDPNRFLIGVQWHPERLATEDPRQAKLISAFVEAARAGKKKRFSQHAIQ